MANTTYYPTLLTEELVKQAESKTPQPRRRYITVLVQMPHLRKYGKNPMMRLTYGADFPVSPGDTVLCPPTRLEPRWTKGTVVELDPGSYRGPVKYVRPINQPTGKR